MAAPVLYNPYEAFGRMAYATGDRRSVLQAIQAAAKSGRVTREARC
jgi:hypothetical protein